METTDLSRPVPVVRLIVRDPHGRVLVVRREPGSTDGGRWCLPGGKIDYGETVEQAAARELQEETALRATNLRFLFYQDSLAPAPGRMHCINFYFGCGTEDTVALNDESTEAAWITREESPSYRLSFKNDEGLARYWAEG